MPDSFDTLIHRASEARRAGRLEDAKRDLLNAIDQCPSAHEQLKLAQALEALGRIEKDLHHPDAARKHYEEAAAIYRIENYELGLAHAIRHIADLHREAGNTADAESSYDYTLWLYRDIKETTPLELANAIRGLALLKNDSAQIERAKQLWTEARDLYAEAKVQAGLDECNRRLALLIKKQAT